ASPNSREHWRRCELARLLVAVQGAPRLQAEAAVPAEEQQAVWAVWELVPHLRSTQAGRQVPRSRLRPARRGGGCARERTGTRVVEKWQVEASSRSLELPERLRRRMSIAHQRPLSQGLARMTQRWLPERRWTVPPPRAVNLPR